MKLIKILKCKRGVAIENAIVFMIITFALCTLLIAVTLTGHYQMQLGNVSLLRDVDIDQIGEEFLSSVRNEDHPFDESSLEKNYSCEIDVDNENTLIVSRRNKTVLYVKVDYSGNVIMWRYSYPT